MFELYLPVKPKHVNQEFGNNPDYYKKFGLNGHNGLDLVAYHGQPVYAAHSGNAFWEIDANQGEGVVLRTPELVDYETDNYSQVYMKSIYWHLCDGVKEPQFASPIWLRFKNLSAYDQQYTGIPVQCGDLIGYADNTGAPYESSGDHLHFGLKPQLPGEPNGSWYNVQQNNGFLGAIDPTPFLNGKFAEDMRVIINNLQQQVSLYTKVVQLLKQLLGLK